MKLCPGENAYSPEKEVQGYCPEVWRVPCSLQDSRLVTSMGSAASWLGGLGQVPIPSEPRFPHL